MNYSRGMFRVWVVLAVVWMLGAVYFSQERLTASRMVKDCSSVTEFECLFAGENDPRIKTNFREPDWDSRIAALKDVLVWPIATLVLALLFRMAGAWIVRGFRGP